MLRLSRHLIGSAHPLPSAVVTAVTVVLGIAVGLPAGTLLLLGTTMLLGQLSVGLSNDWLDAERDRAVGRPDKPVAAGLVSAATVRTAATATAAGSVLIGLGLEWPCWGVHALFLSCGWAYNLGLKRTAWSLLPYLLAFGLLPVVVTTALPAPRPAAAWAVVAGALLGLAAHLANALPDLEDDARTGVAGLPHRLGARASVLTLCLALPLASAVAAFGPGPAGPAMLAPFALTVAASVAAALAARHGSGRAVFRLVMLMALTTVTMLAAAGARIAV